MLSRIATAALLVTLLAAPSVMAVVKDDKPAKDKEKDSASVPEIAPVAAGAIGLCVVGGLALLTTRRRSMPAGAGR